MEIYAARLGIHDFDLPISALFWGAVIFVAVVAAWILVGRAIGRLRNRRLDGGAVEGGHTKGSQFDQTLAEIWNSEDRTEHGTGNQREAMGRRKARVKKRKSTTTIRRR